ncbi:MAG: hypothetical protein ACLTA1_00200 [Clostridia bacterium]
MEAFILSYTDGGYDYIRITIRPYIESDASRMTAAAAIEQYNICEYSIPLADSVPHELYETMHYPIFQAREISEDVLRLRILAVSEQGEDQTQKESMSFSLLCGDTVVEYSIKGAKLEPGAVLDMIQSASFSDPKKDAACILSRLYFRSRCISCMHRLLFVLWERGGSRSEESKVCISAMIGIESLSKM